MPLGGISPERSLARICSHASRRVRMLAGSRNFSTAKRPEARRALWQGAQVLVRTGLTSWSKEPARAREQRKRGAVKMTRRRGDAEEFILVFSASPRLRVIFIGASHGRNYSGS